MTRSLLAVALCVAGCGGMSASRAQARGAVLATAEAVKIGDEACAKQALERKDLELAQRCETAYKAARASLLTASAGVDAWDEGKRAEVTCAVVHAARSVEQTASELRTRKIEVPKILDDSVRLASALGGCHE